MPCLIATLILLEPATVPTPAAALATIDTVGVFNCDELGRFADDYHSFTIEVGCANNLPPVATPVFSTCKTGEKD